MLCNDCDKRGICSTLCCPEAELSASQDDVDWHDEGVTMFYRGEELRIFNSGTGVERAYFSHMEKAVLLRLGEGETRKEISRSLNITGVYLRTIIKRLRDKALHLSGK